MECSGASVELVVAASGVLTVGGLRRLLIIVFYLQAQQLTPQACVVLVELSAVVVAYFWTPIS